MRSLFKTATQDESRLLRARELKQICLRQVLNALPSRLLRARELKPREASLPVRRARRASCGRVN